MTANQTNSQQGENKKVEQIILSPRGSKTPIVANVEFVQVSNKKDTTKTKYVISKCVREVSFNLGLGSISLPNKKLTSLEGLGIQLGLEKLYLQNNYLTNFNYLEVQPRLRELRLENNQITTFKSLLQQPKLEDLWLQNNPISFHPLYRIMCLLVVGKSLRKVDGQSLSQLERMQASLYNTKVVKALTLGWLLDYQERTEFEYDKLIDSLKRGYYDENNSNRASIDQDMIKEKANPPNLEIRFIAPDSATSSTQPSPQLTPRGETETQYPESLIPPPLPPTKKTAKANEVESKLAKQSTPKPSASTSQPVTKSADLYEITNLKNLVKTLAETLHKEQDKRSVLEKELFEKEEKIINLEDERNQLLSSMNTLINEENKQKQELEEKLYQALRTPKVIEGTVMLTGEMLCEMDTAQFYPQVLVKNQDGEETSKSGCISFNDVGINVLVPPGDMFNIGLGETVKITKDKGKRLIFQKPNGKYVVIEDARKDLIAFYVESWLKYKQK